MKKLESDKRCTCRDRSGHVYHDEVIYGTVNRTRCIVYKCTNCGGLHLGMEEIIWEPASIDPWNFLYKSDNKDDDV